MKSFLKEYGFAILIVAVAAFFIIVASPLSANIKNEIFKSADALSNAASKEKKKLAI